MMARDRFRTVVTAIITFEGTVLIGKKQQKEGHPISGKWHILGGHLDHGETLENAVKREVKEETGLEVEVHQVVDVMSFDWNSDGQQDSLRFVYHVEAETDEAEARDDLADVKWVRPGNLVEKLETKDAERLQNRENQRKFLEKLEKAPLV